MDLDSLITLEHLLFVERTCRSCGESLNLIEDFYITRRSKPTLPSSYSYECKNCTVKRIVSGRRSIEGDYPDW